MQGKGRTGAKNFEVGSMSTLVPTAGTTGAPPTLSLKRERELHCPKSEHTPAQIGGIPAGQVAV